MAFQKNDLLGRHPSDIAENIGALNQQEQLLSFLLLPGYLQAEVFAYLDRLSQETLLQSLGNQEIADILNNMTPDDRTAVFEEFPDSIIKDVVNLLAPEERKVALRLIGYAEGSVGRLMTPYYIQVKKEWTIDQTLRHIKKHGKKAETLDFVYVVDDQLKLIDDLKIGRLLLAEDSATIESVMDFNFVSLHSTMSREDAIHYFEKYDRAALPVVSERGVLVGIVTVDDILDEIEKRDTEDIQKFGGLEALELPYVQTQQLVLIRKRAGWLIILFLSEMLTATAMGYFEAEISKAVVLALFVPLIISSGGNSGSQAATLIIRAMALKEINLRNWWFVVRREVFSGLALGGILGGIGFVRILIWQQSGLYDYGPFWFYIALVVAFSLVGVVLWGTITGSMIPFVLKRFGFDPATSSAPFVATLVDVTGLIIYFSIGAIFLGGKLL